MPPFIGFGYKKIFALIADKRIRKKQNESKTQSEPICH